MLTAPYGTLAATTLTATKDSSGAPWVFTLGADGTVFYDQDRPTNNASNPYVFTGLQTLPDLKATAIAATIDAATGTSSVGSGPAVFALTGPYSYIYEDRFVATGHPATPFAWTGWQQISNFVASSIVAVTPPHGSPIVFAVGYDQHVYADNYYGPNTSVPGTWSGFNLLAGIQATSIAATTDSYGDTYLLALNGPVSYVYGGLYVAVAPVYTGSPTYYFSGWSTTGGLAATELTAGIGSDALPAYYATDYHGVLYEFEYTPTTFGTYNTFGWSRFQSLGVAANVPLYQVAETNADGYFTIFGLTGPSSPVYVNQYVPSPIIQNNYTWTGWHVQDSITAKAVAATTNLSGTPLGFASNIYGGLETDTASASGNIYSPNTWSGWQSATSYYAYPFTSADSPTGFPILFTIGPDGSVYYDYQTGPGSGTSLPLTGFVKLDSIEATSIEATIDGYGGVDVFALAGSASNVFEDQITFTSNSSIPVISSGWQSLGSFVGSAFAVMAPPGLLDGPFVFAIGGDGNVWSDEDLQASHNLAGIVTLWTGFTAIPTAAPGRITAISVTSGAGVTGSAYCLFALTGVQSYVYANFLDEDIDTPPTPYADYYNWETWQTVSSYVGSSIAASNPGIYPQVAIIGSNGLAYQSTYHVSIAPGFPNFFSPYSALGGLPGHATTITAVSTPGEVTYAALTGTVSYAYEYQEPLTTQSWQSPGYFVAISLTASIGAGGLPLLIATGYDGRIYINQANYSGNTANPYIYYGWTSLGFLPLYF